jgi:ribosome-binding factor A
MGSRRLLKAAEAIREVVGMSILTDLRDPRICDVTVTYVEVAADMRLARVHVSVMGDERKQQLSLHGLQNSAGYLQHKISQRIDTRYTPKLEFVLDKGIKNAMRVTEILRDVLPADSKEGGEQVAEGDRQRPAHEVAHDELRNPNDANAGDSHPAADNGNDQNDNDEGAV